MNLEVCTALFYDKHREFHGSAGLCSAVGVVHCLLQPNNTGLELLQRELEKRNEPAGLFAEFHGSVTEWIREMNHVIFVASRQFSAYLLARLPFFK